MSTPLAQYMRRVRPSHVHSLLLIPNAVSIWLVKWDGYMTCSHYYWLQDRWGDDRDLSNPMSLSAWLVLETVIIECNRSHYSSYSLYITHSNVHARNKERRNMREPQSTNSWRVKQKLTKSRVQTDEKSNRNSWQVGCKDMTAFQLKYKLMSAFH